MIYGLKKTCGNISTLFVQLSRSQMTLTCFDYYFE